MNLPSVWGVALSFLLAAPSFADVVLIVDVSDPTAVSFSATTNTSQVNDSSAGAFDGVTLQSFLTSDEDLAFTMTGSLSPSGIAGTLDTLTTFDTIIEPLGVNLHADQSFDTMAFSTSTPAFTGSSVANLSGLALPAPGTSGNVVAGDAVTGSGAIIGQWQVTAVPEPSSFICLTLLGLTVSYRRWRRNQLDS